MAIAENNESIVLSSVANYQTVNILELMSLTPGLDDEQVRKTVDAMEKSNLVSLTGAGDDQFVSVTDKGYSYLSSLRKFA
jgi:hypothetical protein